MNTSTVPSSAKPLRTVKTVKQLLVNDMAKQQLASVATSHMRPERMMRLMANAMRTTPLLMECEPLSLLGAMMTCASLGLEPNTPLGHAYLIPFKNKRKGIVEVQLIIGYKGMIALSRRSGLVVNIHADVAYEGDQFSYEYGSNQHLKHIPAGPRDKPTHAYCHAKLVDGEAFIVLPWAVVLETRDASQGYRSAMQYGNKDNPWIKHMHSMAKKTAVRRLFDEMPIAIEEVSNAIQIDEQANDFSAFAMDPTIGAPSSEGEVIDAAASDQEEEDTGAVAKEQAKPKPTSQAKNKPATKGKSTGDGQMPAADKALASAEKLFAFLESEIINADDPNEAQEMYTREIDKLKGLDEGLHATLIDKIHAEQDMAAPRHGGGLDLTEIPGAWHGSINGLYANLQTANTRADVEDAHALYADDITVAANDAPDAASLMVKLLEEALKAFPETPDGEEQPDDEQAA